MARLGEDHDQRAGALPAADGSPRPGGEERPVRVPAGSGPLRARVPAATYRLQFNHRFTFADATTLLPYLSELGISDVYASPYLKARAGSLHGYDIVNPQQLNPEIGTEEDYRTFVGELQRLGMGQVADLVPNHMCITSRENRWWMDVLENGPSSPYARFFDIDWHPIKPELENRLLLPILGEQYGTVLERGELRLVFEEGGFFIAYYDHRLPLRYQSYSVILGHRLDELKDRFGDDHPALIELLSIMTALSHLPHYTETAPERVEVRQREKEVIKRRLATLSQESGEIARYIDASLHDLNGRSGDPRSFDPLDRLISEQVYRLSSWRVAADEINYRRFFDINELAAIRTEDPLVFEETHRLLFELIADGSVTGLRIDHPDGLYDPAGYLRRWQSRCAELLGAGRETVDPFDKPFYIVGEKILSKGERMPEDWPIFSTTGYVFLNSVNGLFVRIDRAKAMDRLYARFIKTEMSYPDVVYECKKLIMQIAMSSEINMLGHHLDRLSETDWHTRDFTLNSLTAALMEVIAFFPVYRTYASPSGVNDRDRRYIELAVGKATRKNPAISDSIFGFLKDVLLLNNPPHHGEDKRIAWREFVMKFQQLTGPVMAKGAEDTACYLYNRLISLNEVGGAPDRFGTTLETFHGQNIERSKFWPHAMITTATHDTKRGEDVRTRIDVLTELPDEWKTRVMRWRRVNRKRKPVVEGRPVPEPNEEYLLYQILVGAWPIEPLDGEAHAVWVRRVADYLLKAVREAKVNSSWISPNRPYEEALALFIDRLLGARQGNAFLEDFLPFQRRVSHYGLLNALSQLLLKMTAPGVPDFYQGTELWDFNLVDPDNRRPVDYDLRLRRLAELKRRELDTPRAVLAQDLARRKEDGMIKLYLMSTTLNHRRRRRAVYDEGDYLPLEADGALSDHLCAFARQRDGEGVIVVAPRWFTGLAADSDGLPTGVECWGETALHLPFAKAGDRWMNLFTGDAVTVMQRNGASVLRLSEVLAVLPVALLSYGMDGTAV
jgi:(1->4)-alpha-D-glucan 1-alpha-D-glucosylmutase